MHNEEQNNESINVDDLFRNFEDLPEDNDVPEEPATEVTDKDTTDAEEHADKDVMTKAVTERINTVKRKTEADTRESVAKELGYNSYEELLKSKEQNMMKEAGLDEERTGELVSKLVEQRLANDPRFKKLEEIESLEKNNFVTSQLNEINSFAGTNYKGIEELPEDILKVFEKTGNLKQAYLAIEGENLITKAKVPQNTGSLAHLANPGDSRGAVKTRHLSEEEKELYRMVNPGITEEELLKKTLDID